MTDDFPFRVGDLVWCTKIYENLYMPMRICGFENERAALVVTADNWDGRSKIEPIVFNKAERMPVFCLSKEHPLGWRIITRDGTELK